MKKAVDISAYKKSAPPAPQPVLKTQTSRSEKSRSKVIGRPPKVDEERRNQKVTLSLTEKELSVLKEKAGLIPAATFLFAELKKAGVFD